MKVSVQRIDGSLPLPRYETAGAVGFDLITRKTTVIPPGALGLVPGNVVVKVPEGYALLIVPRSSLPQKKMLVCPHSLGVIDQDYCGSDDEIFIQVQNVGTAPVMVERGERIAQGIFVRVDQAQWQEVDGHEAATRGGFGSTGTSVARVKLPGLTPGASPRYACGDPRGTPHRRPRTTDALARHSSPASRPGPPGAWVNVPIFSSLDRSRRSRGRPGRSRASSGG